MLSKKCLEYAQNAFTFVLDATPPERLLVISDEEKTDVGEIFAYAGLRSGLLTRWIRLNPGKNVIREDLPSFLREAVTTNESDIVVTCLRGPAEETPFRIKLIHLITKNKDKRLGHGPGVTKDMFSEGALALSDKDYHKMNDLASKMINATNGAKYVNVASQNGTEVKMVIHGRSFFTDVNITNEKWGNLPVGEITVAPIENSLEGTLVCDLAIGGIGPIKEPVKIKCKDGKAVKVTSKDIKVTKKVKKTLSTDSMASVVGEMAIGINPKARIIKEFVETEKVFGTAHIAFGRNIDFPTGGNNNSANHMDFLIDKPNVNVIMDNDIQIEIVSNGKITI
jgi:hypothetical protein